MKLCYTLILLFVEALIAFTLYKARVGKTKKSSLAQKMNDLLLAAFFTVLPNVFIAYANSELAAKIFFSWYFSLIDVLLFFMLYFTVEYSFPSEDTKRSWIEAFSLFFKHDIAAVFRKEKQRTSFIEKLMLLLFLGIIADVVAFILNIFYGFSFTVEAFYYTGSLFSPDTYFRIVSFFPYNLHLSFSYIMVSLTLICLVQKIVVSPVLYRIKYVGVLLMLLLVVILNSFYIMLALPVDFSVTPYGLFCVLIYYFSYSYIPKYLRRESLNRVIKNMENGIFIFDSENHCIYINEYIRKLYGLKPNQDAEDAVVQFMQSFPSDKALSQREPYEETVHFIVDGSDKFFRLSFDRMESKNGKYVGCYFLLLDVSEENNREQQEHYRNTHDALTGIYNKEFFFDKVSEMLEANPDRKYCILCSDIGNFKSINEIYGVAVGDKVLKLIALTLQERAVPGEVYGRIDNDRFAMLIPKERLDMQKFIDAVDYIFRSSLDLAVMPTCYFGVYEIEDFNMRISFMCDRAFVAIDTIKGQFDKQVAWYDATLRDNVLREQELVYQLPEAIATDQIQIYFQPQSLQDGKAIGAETLVRWEHPDEGLVAPSEFLPLFERNGMITKIDRHVWNLAFKKLLEWQNRGHTDVYLSVNVSPKDFYLMDIHKEFRELLKEYPINPKNLHIEITEGIMMMDLDRQIVLIEQLRNLGFVIEIGDFGVGYSSLKILRECNIEILKLDISFLEKTNVPRNAHIIMKQLISMAHNLGIKVLAKGIEKKDQMDLLFADGCDYFQGFYFSKPLDSNMFEKIYL